MTLCRICDRKVAQGQTINGRAVILDLEQKVYTPLTLGERRQMIQTMLSVAEHRCIRKEN